MGSSLRGALIAIAIAGCGSEATAPVAGRASGADVVAPPAPPTVRLERCGEVELLPTREVAASGQVDPARYGTVTHDSGTGSGYGVGGHGGGTHPYAEAVMGAVTATGPLDVAIVKRYLRRNAAKFTYCYEKQLVITPGLRGAVDVEWTIAADGTVSTARARGVDPAIAACVGRYVLGIEFPAPRDGGTVAARVAFTLTPHDHERPAKPRPGAADWVTATPPPPPAPPPPTAWTSFARRSEIPSLPASDGATGASQAAVAARLPAITACFPAAAPDGSLRAVLRADNRGAIVAVATGGYGDAAIEACVSEALVGITALPTACDFTRGAPAPWRVSRAGYAVVEVGASDLRLDGTVVHLAAERPPTIAADATVLVIADPAAPAARIEQAIAWAGPGHDVVLAIAQGGVAVFASAFAMAPRGAPVEVVPHARPVLAVRGAAIAACVDGKALAESAPAGDAAAIERLLGAIATACTGGACDRVIEIVPDGGAPIEGVRAAAAAIRRAGRVPVIGARASDTRCPP
ncbi:MAG: AgmX/PglI C-terminal domain-containing protein [Deltaproteobacteria bacterium]|nr:AgmX/PglI C-terminal domain-containing protein [Deltaproteobacteria bacterium]